MSRLYSNIITKTQDLLKLNNKENLTDWSKLMEHALKQEMLIQEIEEIAKEHNTILGRIIQFPVADSYAKYIITKVNKKTVNVQRVNHLDGYMDRRIGPEGKVDRKFAEETILGIDNVKSLFS